MVDEQQHDESAGHEEEAYHFSDEQHDYELGTEASAPAATVKKVPLQQRLKEGFLRHRRIFLGAVGFLFLLAVVYRLMVPVGPPTVSTELTPASAPPQTRVATTTTAPISQQPAMTSTLTDSAKPAVAASTQAEEGRMQAMTALKQSQSDTAEQLSSMQTQNTQLQQQVVALTSRVTAMEAAFHELAQMLQQAPAAKPLTAAADQGDMSDVSNNAADNFSVQAIIPGRAWLKTASGKTITVQNGDSLRGLGRVVDIDPYDGVVKVASGKQIVSLSYGANNNDD